MHLKNARPDERVIREFTVSTRYSIIQLLAALGVVVVFYVLALVAIQAELLNIPASSLFWIIVTPGIVAAVYLALGALYLRLARRYFLTTQRVIEIEGFLSQRNSSADYANITDMTVIQDAFERFVSATGSVEVNTAGGPTKELRLIHVDNPVGVRDQILELSEKAKRLLARIRDKGENLPINVAPTSASYPIATDPTIVDTNNDAVIDTEETRNESTKAAGSSSGEAEQLPQGGGGGNQQSPTSDVDESWNS